MKTKETPITDMLIEHMNEDGELNLDKVKATRLLVWISQNQKLWDEMCTRIDDMKKTLGVAE